MNPLWIGGAGILGALTAGWLGWMESKEKFDVRKFGSTMIRGLFAGVGIAIGWNYMEPLNPWAVNLFVAFGIGAGIDVLGNRLAGTIAAR